MVTMIENARHCIQLNLGIFNIYVISTRYALRNANGFVKDNEGEASKKKKVSRKKKKVNICPLQKETT